jgi:hypothetical protein
MALDPLAGQHVQAVAAGGLERRRRRGAGVRRRSTDRPRPTGLERPSVGGLDAAAVGRAGRAISAGHLQERPSALPGREIDADAECGLAPAPRGALRRRR